MPLKSERKSNKTVLVTGSKGFIGENLIARLECISNIDVLKFDRSNTLEQLKSNIKLCDFIVHLAGENRPREPQEFARGNIELTEIICQFVRSEKRPMKIIFSSSRKAKENSDYGKSKKGAEGILEKLCQERNFSASVFQFPNVFGKWSRPNYNSVVATFCYNIARDLPIKIYEKKAPIELLYVDDAVDQIISEICDRNSGYNVVDIKNAHHTTVGSIADTITKIHNLRSGVWLGDYSDTLFKKLHATYLSYLPVEEMSLPMVANSDSRGKFIEFCKSDNGGQLSFITILKGQKRGGHYHHTKVEKFIVLSGEVEFRFFNVKDNKYHSLTASGSNPKVVETFPGWAHQLINVGTQESFVAVWANEPFDSNQPDTYECKF